MTHYPCHGTDRTEVWGEGSTLSDDFTFVAVLLISEQDTNIGDAVNVVHVIQEGRFMAIVSAAMESEAHMAELKDLSAQSGCLATRVRDEELTRTHQEEEPDHGEMVDVKIDGAFSGMVKVQVVPQSRDKF